MPGVVGVPPVVPESAVAPDEPPAPDEVWLPERVTWTASARVLLVKSLRLRGVSEFSNYRKFTVGTSTTFARPSE